MKRSSEAEGVMSFREGLARAAAMARPRALQLSVFFLLPSTSNELLYHEGGISCRTKSVQLPFSAGAKQLEKSLACMEDAKKTYESQHFAKKISKEKCTSDRHASPAQHKNQIFFR